MREENVLRTAREDGLKEGIKKGIKQGIQEGREQGIQEEKLETIKNMFKEELDYQTISEVTGKTIMGIKNIESSM